MSRRLSANTEHRCVPFAALTAFALTLALGGCALGTGGDSLAPSVTGQARAATPSTQSWSCDMIETALRRDVEHLVALRTEIGKTRGQPPNSLARLFTGDWGKAPPDKEQDFARTRAEADGYNEAAKTKGCATVDIDNALRSAKGSSPLKADEPPSEVTWPKPKSDVLEWR